MKFKSLHDKAKQLDNLIDDYLKTRRNGFVPFRNLEKMVKGVFPEAVRVNYGLHKLVFGLRHKTHMLALKIGREKTMEFDHKVYKHLPTEVRHVYFARIFWHTKYTLLQEWGEEVEVSPEQLLQLRAVTEKHGLLDITCENIRSVNGNLKIIDAAVAPNGLFRLWKTYDSLNRRLPSPVRKAFRKSRELATIKQ